MKRCFWSSILPFFLFISMLLPQAQAQKSGKTAPSLETYLAAANRLFDKLDAFSGILEGVTDKATAEASKPKLEKLIEEYRTVVKEAQALGEPDAATQKKMAADPKMLARTQEVRKKMTAATHKVGSIPDALAVLKPSLVEFQKVTQSGQTTEVDSATTQPVPLKRQK